MSSGEERIKEQVARRQDDLLDLTGRDRLLRLRHTETASLEIDSPGTQANLDRLLGVAAVRIDGERGEVGLR